jgi:hypothetical protein
MTYEGVGQYNHQACVNIGGLLNYISQLIFEYLWRIINIGRLKQTRHLIIFLKSLKTIGETIKEDLEVNTLAISIIDDRWRRLIHDSGRLRLSYCCCKKCVEKYFKI